MMMCDISGLVLLPGALFMAFMMMVSGRLFDKYGVKKLAIPGLILLVISTIPFILTGRYIYCLYYSHICYKIYWNSPCYNAITDIRNE